MIAQNQNSGETRSHKVATVDEIARGSGKKVEVGGNEIAIFNFNGIFYAISDICPHRGAPLSEGFLEAGKVFCPWHCFDFNLQTGECTTVPSLNVRTYEVKIEGDDVLILCR
jgi:NAD(P)H-dependent nitrite reductase small subunit